METKKNLKQKTVAEIISTATLTKNLETVTISMDWDRNDGDYLDRTIEIPISRFENYYQKLLGFWATFPNCMDSIQYHVSEEFYSFLNDEEWIQYDSESGMECHSFEFKNITYIDAKGVTFDIPLDSFKVSDITQEEYENYLIENLNYEEYWAEDEDLDDEIEKCEIPVGPVNLVPKKSDVLFSVDNEDLVVLDINNILKHTMEEVYRSLGGGIHFPTFEGFFPELETYWIKFSLGDDFIVDQGSKSTQISLSNTLLPTLGIFKYSELSQSPRVKSKDIKEFCELYKAIAIEKVTGQVINLDYTRYIEIRGENLIATILQENDKN